MPGDPATMLFWGICLVWLTALGGCVGSFLNVVVYRLPRGQSLSYPGSRCPKCGHPIRWYHNVPVLGWLALRGQCYDCRTPIAARYPLVEGVVAIVFFLLAVTGPLSATFLDSARPAEAAPAMGRSLWMAWAWEAYLLSTLLALALIDRDLSATGEGRYPLPLIGATLLLAVILPILVPGMLIHTQGGPTTLAEPPGLRASAEHAGFGTLAGCGCGCLMFAASRGSRAALRQAPLPALVGPYLGPWVTIELVAVTLLFSTLPRLLSVWNRASARKGTSASRFLPWSLLFWLATLVGVLVAHRSPAVFTALSSPSLPLKLAIGGSLLLVLLAAADAARLPGGHVE